MTRTIYVIGEPATGKTTLMLEVRKRLGEGKDMKYGNLYFTRYEVPGCGSCLPSIVDVLGVYDGKGTFQGTDRLSMNVSTAAKDFLRKTERINHVVLAEGDRLACAPFWDEAKAAGSLQVFVLVAPAADLQDRRTSRNAHGETQDAKWLQGRRTKVLNLMTKYDATPLDSRTSEDRQAAAAALLAAFP